MSRIWTCSSVSAAASSLSTEATQLGQLPALSVPSVRVWWNIREGTPRDEHRAGPFGPALCRGRFAVAAFDHAPRLRRAVYGSVLSARSRFPESSSPKASASLRRTRSRCLPLSRGRGSGPVPDSIHDPCGSSSCGPGANRNRHGRPWFQPRCPGWSPVSPTAGETLMPYRFRTRRIPPESPLASFGSSPSPLSHRRSASSPPLRCFRIQRPGHRKYDWLSPQGSSVKLHSQALAKDGGPTVHRSRKNLASRPGARRPGLLSLSPVEGAPPSKAPKRFARIAGPAFLGAFTPNPADRPAPLVRKTWPPGRTAPYCYHFRSAVGQEALRSSPAKYPPCSGLAAGAAFRLHQPGPLQVTSQPSSNRGVGFSISPTPRSELHSIKRIEDKGGPLPPHAARSKPLP